MIRLRTIALISSADFIISWLESYSTFDEVGGGAGDSSSRDPLELQPAEVAIRLIVSNTQEIVVLFNREKRENKFTRAGANDGVCIPKIKLLNLFFAK